MEKFRKTFITFSLFVISLSLSLSLALSETNNQTVSITKIKVKGAEHVSIKEIKEKIGTEFPSIKPWATDPEFDEEILKDDMLRIHRLYGDHGYYDAKAEYSLEYNDTKDCVEITIKIEEGKPVILKDLNIDLPEYLNEEVKKDILDSLPIKVDKDFSSIKYQQAKLVISAVLSNNGYPNPVIEGEAIVNRKEKWAKVSLKVNPGLLYRFGSITAEGNEKVQSYVITRESTFEKGDIYSAKKLDDTQSRIFQLGLFSSVLIDTDLKEETATANVNVKVKERKLGEVKIGAGFGTEDLFRGQVVWTKRNFLGGGRRLSVSASASFITQRFLVNLLQPYIIGGGSELSASLNFERDDFPGFDAGSIVGTVGVRKRFSQFFNAFGSFNVQASRLSNVSNETELFIERNNYFVTFFNFGVSINTTDNILNPRNGTVAIFVLEPSFKALGSQVNYVKGTLQLIGYKELLNLVFAKSITVGFIQPFGGDGTFSVPIFKRFFAGGSTSMRGFPFQKLGPLDANQDPIGGNSLLVGSFEIRFPIYKDLGGVVFFDYGNVYTNEFEYKLDQLKYAPGIGLRYNTIIGPIRFDFGYALNPEPGIRRYQFFFSIGQAF
ncbi:MAG: outer membrane protein assembly factor BamA [Candidatus Dadabacteria bacterium]|nr:outer membrane protein assembly factor BamA [Candidatus Dadabacteria bacterium]